MQIMSKNLFIIDGHAHIYAAFYAPMAQRLTSPTGESTKATYIFTTAVLGLIKNSKPDMLVVAMDSKARTFRSDIYPEYKAHRPPMPDDLPSQIIRIEQILEILRIPMLRVDGFEADDIIATISKKASAQGLDTYICGKDKDLFQLINDHVFLFDMKTQEKFDRAAVIQKMNLAPEQFIDLLALCGDTVDNIPGVPDVGPKTAQAWIQQYGSLENLFAHADEIGGKRGDNLRNSKEKVLLSKKLVTLNYDVPIEIDYENFAVKKFDEEKVKKLFTEFGFNRLLTQLGLSPAANIEHPKITPQEIKKEPEKNIPRDYQLVDTPEKFEEFFKEFKKQTIFVINTIATSQYPMRADLVGISFAWENHKAFYLPVRASMGAKHLNLNILREKLAPVFVDESIKKIGHNIKNDMLILQNFGMPLKGIYFDTMVASYCLQPMRDSHTIDTLAKDFLNCECMSIESLTGKGKNQLTLDMVDTALTCEYSGQCADMIFQIYDILKQRLDSLPELKKLFDEVEMPLVSVLAAMEFNGVSLDVKLLKNLSHEIHDALKNLTDKIYEYAGMPFNIDSPKQLAEVLFDKLGLEPIRIGKTGRSTDAGVLEELSGRHPIIEPILEYRVLSKLKNTYVDKLGSLINHRTVRVHASFNQTITATGRLSSSDPNLQNIPIKDEIGRKIRAAFIPQDKTGCILSADYSQIELRLLASFSKDPALMDAFAKNQDIHTFVASQIFNVPIEQVTSEMRSKCKAVNFGIIYGQGAFGLSQVTGLNSIRSQKIHRRLL